MSNLWEDLVERFQDKFNKAALRITTGSFLCELAAEQKKNETKLQIVLREEVWLSMKY